MSRFLDQIRKAKEAQRHAADQAKASTPSSGEASDELVPETSLAPPPVPESPEAKAEPEILIPEPIIESEPVSESELEPMPATPEIGLVPESLAEIREPVKKEPPVPPPEPSEERPALVPESLAEQRPAKPYPQAPVPEPEGLSDAFLSELFAEDTVSSPPPSPSAPTNEAKSGGAQQQVPVSKSVKSPAPSVPSEPAPSEPIASEPPCAKAVTPLRAQAGKPSIAMAAPDIRREGQAFSGAQKLSPKKGTRDELFPKELETQPSGEEISAQSRGEETVFLSDKGLNASPRPRPVEAAPSSPRLNPASTTQQRKRSRREIVISGPEVNPDFVRRIAKIAPRPDTRVVSFYQPKHNVCEEYRLLGKNILHAFSNGSASTDRGRIVTLTSSVRNEGKTLTAVNLAMTLAQDLKDRVLLLDGDLRHPRVHTYIGAPAGTGLNDLLASSDPASILEDCLLRTDMGLHLLLASASRANPAPLLDSPASTNLLNLLRERYALILIDTPPVLLATDALTLGVRSDGMLFLIRARKTKREQIQEARQRIARLDIRMLGYVMNKVRTFLPKIWRERFYYYGHY